TKVEFVNAIWKFVQNPSEELSIMPGAVRNFSLMPKQNFKEEEVKIIASYLFDNDVSSDSWYNKWDSLNKK
ncbi:MAG: cytochrome c family protein, partial [Bacteroidetes bacterium]|nr:cytochrome c family protein [Bacteroidota bacterium]